MKKKFYFVCSDAPTDWTTEITPVHETVDDAIDEVLGEDFALSSTDETFVWEIRAVRKISGREPAVKVIK